MFDPIVSGMMPAPTAMRRGRTSGDQPKLSGSSPSISRGERQAARDLLLKKVPFIDSPEYRKRGAERRIFDDAPGIASPDVAWYRPLVEDLSAHTSRDARLRHTTPLTALQERTLFRQLNYSLYRIERTRRLVRGGAPSESQVRAVVRWRRRAEVARRHLSEANVALVLAMARRVRADDMEFADLIGEGNMALMRSVDKFDCERGFKFSTYACRAILKAFSRAGIKSTKHRQRFPVAFDPDLEFGEAADPASEHRRTESSPELRELLERNTAGLSSVEQSVVENRFGFTAHFNDGAPTLEEVGRRLGLTKERVRQIQNQALAKLRVCLSQRDRAPAPAPSLN